MRPSLDFSGLKRTQWYEYLIRFVFGGLITAVAGLIATKYGPAVGGLFLAFPAIFPASVTLIESHERKKKEEAGLKDDVRGIEAAGVDALGAELGSIGMMAFGVTVFWLAPKLAGWQALGFALTAWILVSTGFWIFRKKI
jgi:hypothetical protein